MARLNGKAVKGVKAGYLRLDRAWRKGDRVELEFDMGVRVIEAFDASRRFALRRGPLVLAQDSRLGAVDAPFRPVGGRPVKPPKGIFFAYRFDDGTTVCPPSRTSRHGVAPLAPFAGARLRRRPLRSGLFGIDSTVRDFA